MDSAMIQQAKSIARHLGLTLRQVRSGDYRVNFRGGNEMTAYYTDSLENAVNTAVEMDRTCRAATWIGCSISVVSDCICFPKIVTHNRYPVLNCEKMTTISMSKR